MTFVRNMQDEESREFWRGIDAGVREFQGWPEWKRRMVAGEGSEEPEPPKPPREAESRS